MLFQLGGEIYRIADHRIFQAGFIAHRPEDNVAGHHGGAQDQRCRAGIDAVPAPFVRRRDNGLQRAQRIGGVGFAGQDRPERRQNAIAKKFIDTAPMFLDRRYHARLIFHQNADQVGRR